MGDEDIDAMLEAPFKEKDEEPERRKENDKPRKEERHKESSGDEKEEKSEKVEKREKKKKKRDRSRSRSRDNKKEKERDKSRESKKKEKSRERSPRKSERRRRTRSRSRSPRRERRRRSRSPFRPPPFRRSPPPPRRHWSPYRDISSGGRRLPGPERRDVMPFTARKSPPKDAKLDMTPEEKDARTVFIMQLAARTRPRDLEEFFSSVGRVRDVRIITDSKTRRSKGIGYVEFWELEAVPLALGLNGQRLLGAPLVIQHTMAEKNRAAASGTVGGAMGFSAFPTQTSGPLKLYVGSLHFNITEEMLKGIFEPFGKIDSIQLLKEPDTGRSRGYAFVTFHAPDDAKRAMEHLNGFELAGRPIKVGHVTEHMPQNQRSLDADELDRSGIDLGSSGRLQLMAKLAEGTGLHLPNQAQQVLTANQQQMQMQATPPIATQCFQLSNMFDPGAESEPNWEDDIKDDVIEECSKNGGVLHIYVDKESAQGNVYVKCPSVASAVAAVNSLHGRWFAGKIITANYVPVNNYHNLFPDAMRSTQPLRPAFK